jgi:hypothetical protein
VALGLVLFLFLPSAESATNVGWTIAADTVWTQAASPFVVTSDITVPAGVTLTIEAGVVVKLSGTFITVQGTLRADATGAAPIVFTSLKDDAAGGDTNGDGTASSPAPNDWGRLVFEATSTNNLLSNVLVRYGGGNMLAVYTSGLTLQGSTLSQSAGTGLHIAGAAPTVTGSLIEGHAIGANLVNAAAVVNFNVIRGNSSYGVYNSTATIFADVRFNNWGDPTGPLDGSDDRTTGGLYNPTGRGNRVSDYVNYAPWTGSTPPTTGSPTGLKATPRAGALDLAWNANPEADLFGYRIFYGISSRNYSSTATVGKVTSYRLAGLTNGTPYFIAIASLNALGAESGKSAEVSATPVATPRPTITEFSPNAGVTGSIVRITGSGFGTTQESRRVAFGAVNMAALSWGDTLIEAVVPSLGNGTYDVAVVTDGGSSNTGAFTITGPGAPDN